MLLDKSLEFDPAGTAITTTQASTNIIDLAGTGLPISANFPNRDLGVGNEAGATPKLLVLVQQTFTAAGAATLNVQFQGAPDNGSGAPGTWTTYVETGALPINASQAGSLVANQKIFEIDVPRPAPGVPRPRFIRLNYVVATGPMTAGTVQSELVIERDDLPAYQSGFVVAN